MQAVINKHNKYYLLFCYQTVNRKARSLSLARVLASGAGIGEPLDAGRHGREIEVVVQELPPLHDHVRELPVAGGALAHLPVRHQHSVGHGPRRGQGVGVVAVRKIFYSKKLLILKHEIL